MKRKQGFLFDYNFCIGCKACEISCQVYHNQDPDINWRHVDGLMIHEDGIEKEIFVNYKTVYCGRVDGIGKNIIYDIKTTTKLDVDYISLQLSLYLLAYDEDNYENYTGYVLWLPKRDAGKKIEIPLKTKEEILDIVELIKCLC